MKITKKNKILFANADFWNGDKTLAGIMYAFLKKYKQYQKKTCGYPAAFAPDHLKEEGPDNPDRYNEWIEALDQMIYSFQWIAESKEDFPGSKKHPYMTNTRDGLRFLNEKRPADMVRIENYHQQYIIHNIKIQDGLYLFAKYFRSLWL